MTDDERNTMFLAIWPRIRSEINFLLMRASSIGGTSDIADLEQEASLEVIKALGRYDPARGIDAIGFVRLRAYGAVVDLYRRQNQARLLVVSVGLLPEIRKRYTAPEALRYDAILPSGLMEILSDKEREILIRHYWRDESFGEISRLMGYAQTCGATWGHSSALRKMRQKLSA